MRLLMEASSLCLLTPCPLATPLAPLLITLQKSRGKAVACSHLSPAQPVNQGYRNVEFCSQQDRDAHIKHHFVQFNDTLLGSPFEGTNHFLFSLSVAVIVIHCFGVGSVPLLPSSEAGLFFLLSYV